MKNIIKTIKATSGMSDKSITDFISYFEPLNLRKKDILINADSINRNFYFIEEGISRCFCLVDGKEVTTWFSKEGDTAFSMLGCYQSKPSHDYVQMLDNSLLYSISMNDGKSSLD